MPVDERSRHQLFSHLDQVLGEEDAATLIEHLPPVGWADVATKRDLDALELRLDQRFVGVDQQFSSVYQQFASVDQQFASLRELMDERFASVDQRFTSVDQRFDHMDRRFDQLDRSVDHRLVDHEKRFDVRLEALEHKLLAGFRKELNEQTRLIVFGMVTIVITMASLAFALVRFA